MTDLIITDSAAVAAEMEATADRARENRAKAKAANTLAVHRSDWNDFTNWCRAQPRVLAGRFGDGRAEYHQSGREVQAEHDYAPPCYHLEVNSRNGKIVRVGLMSD